MKFNDIYDDCARPYTASFVVLRKENKVAMILRKNTGWMDQHYGLPAGKVKYSETFTEAAVREASEEVDVTIEPSALKVVHVTHRHGEDKAEQLFMDWVDVYFEAASWQGEPHNAEPEKSERMDWLDLNDLPGNIVPSQRAALVCIAKDEAYSEYGWN